MLVPKATMHKNNCSVFRKNNVRLARQLLHMKSETKARSMKHRPDDYFRLGVTASYSRHVPATLLGRNLVGHLQGESNRNNESLIFRSVEKFVQNLRLLLGGQTK